MLKNEIWISWHVSQRSRNLAKELGLPIFEKVIENNPLSRHLFSSLWTIYILLRERPDKVYMQYSFLLLVVAASYKLLMPHPVHIICDCHTKALRRSVSGRVGKVFWSIKKKSFQSVSVSIISNVEMNPDIKKLTNSYCVLPDKIPDVVSSGKKNKNEVYCVFVSSYAVDEPLDDVIAAAKRLDGTVKIYCTGKIPDGLRGLRKNPYVNICFTDFLSLEEYYQLISNADCVLALTSEEGCLQCAGYESLSAGVPVVLSDTSALKTYFENAAIYVEHNAQEIESGIRRAISHRPELLSNMSRIKQIREHEYDSALNKLRKVL